MKQPILVRATAGRWYWACRWNTHGGRPCKTGWGHGSPATAGDAGRQHLHQRHKAEMEADR